MIPTHRFSIIKHSIIQISETLIYNTQNLFAKITHIYTVRLTCLLGLHLLYRHQTAPHRKCLVNRLLRNTLLEMFEPNNNIIIISKSLTFFSLFSNLGSVKDTHSRCGGDGCNGADGDRLLSITQVSRAVGACHDTCEWNKMK